MQLLCLLSSLLLLGHSCASLALNTYALYLRSIPECAARANRPSLDAYKLLPRASQDIEMMDGEANAEDNRSDDSRRRGGVLDRSEAKLRLNPNELVCRHAS